MDNISIKYLFYILIILICIILPLLAAKKIDRLIDGPDEDKKEGKDFSPGVNYLD